MIVFLLQHHADDYYNEHGLNEDLCAV